MICLDVVGLIDSYVERRRLLSTVVCVSVRPTGGVWCSLYEEWCLYNECLACFFGASVNVFWVHVPFSARGAGGAGVWKAS